jgi:addiction module RelB/DinJ family antitoxin
MPSTQFNMKIDAKLKKQAQELAKKYGLNLSDVLRSFVCYFVRMENVGFLLDDDKMHPDDTDPNLTGVQLMQNLLVDGWDPKQARKQGEAYDRMLQAEKDGTLVHWKDV